jgi:hypothetical protein
VKEDEGFRGEEETSSLLSPSFVHCAFMCRKVQIPANFDLKILQFDVEKDSHRICKCRGGE